MLCLRPLRWRPLAPLLLLVLGCSTASPLEDGGLLRDAVVPDGGTADLGPDSDLGGLPPTNDMGVACDVRVCDPREPSGCGSVSCVLWSAMPACQTADGVSLAGEPCGDVMECAPGLACFLEEGGEGAGVCGAVCCPSSDDDAVCLDEEERCGGSGVLVDGTPTAWGRCVSRRMCDVFAPEEVCAPREGCYIDEEALRTGCRLAGAAEIGDRCEVPEDCAPGLHCSGLTRHCIRICRLEASDCAPGERCVAQAHSPPGTGFCAPDR